MSDFKSITDLQGITGFLNGEPDLHDSEDKYRTKLESIGKKCIIIDNLFAEPAKLKEVLQCDNIVFTTTGQSMDKMQKLLEAFDKLNYIPKAVISHESTIEAICGHARIFHKKGTRFFLLDTIWYDLHEISWL